MVLKLYALYKQAEAGSERGDRPGLFDLIGRAKYDAWMNLGNMNKEEAMKLYVETVKEVFGGKLPDLSLAEDSLSSSAPSSSSASAAVGSSNLSTHVTTTTIDDVLFPRAQPKTKDAGDASGPDYSSLQFIVVDVSPAGVATVTLNRSKKGNAFHFDMWEELRQTWFLLSRDHRVRCVVLKGSNSTFSTGMDTSVFLDLQKRLSQVSCDSRRREALHSFIAYLQSAVNGAEEAPMPVITAVTGHCIGGAIDLITAADLRYCTKDAVFSVKEIDLAIVSWNTMNRQAFLMRLTFFLYNNKVADMGTIQRLPKLIGYQKASELCYTGRKFNGKEAVSMGLCLECFDTESEMHEKVAEIAREIASKSPVTVRGVKKNLLYSRDHTISDGLKHVQLWNSAYLLGSDLMTAAGAMMQKVEPKYKDN